MILLILKYKRPHGPIWVILGHFNVQISCYVEKEPVNHGMRTIEQPPWVPGTTCRAHVVIWEHEKIEFATGFYSAFGGALFMPIVIV